VSDHPTLFAEEPRPYQASKSFLSRNARFFDCLTSSETLRTQADLAAVVAQKKAGAGRNSAALFEDKFKELLLDEPTAAKVVAETMAYAAANDPDLDLREVSIASGKGTALADILVRYRSGEHDAIVIATNIKRLKPGRNYTEGGSIPQLTQLALEENYNPAKPPSPQGFNWEKAIVEWYARRRKIRDGRDYWLLVARVDDGACSAIEAWGALSGLRNNTVVVARHPSRAVVTIAAPTSVLGKETDINREIARSLLPAPSASALRALIVSVAEQQGGPDLAMPLAAKLLDMNDATLFTEVLAAFRQQSR
jgi:hypothetical protein